MTLTTLAAFLATTLLVLLPTVRGLRRPPR